MNLPMLSLYKIQQEVTIEPMDTDGYFMYTENRYFPENPITVILHSLREITDMAYICDVRLRTKRISVIEELDYIKDIHISFPYEKENIISSVTYPDFDKFTLLRSGTQEKIDSITYTVLLELSEQENLVTLLQASAETEVTEKEKLSFSVHKYENYLLMKNLPTIYGNPQVIARLKGTDEIFFLRELSINEQVTQIGIGEYDDLRFVVSFYGTTPLPKLPHECFLKNNHKWIPLHIQLVDESIVFDPSLYEKLNPDDIVIDENTHIPYVVIEDQQEKVHVRSVAKRIQNNTPQHIVKNQLRKIDQMEIVLRATWSIVLLDGYLHLFKPSKLGKKYCSYMDIHGTEWFMEVIGEEKLIVLSNTTNDTIKKILEHPTYLDLFDLTEKDFTSAFMFFHVYILMKKNTSLIPLWIHQLQKFIKGLHQNRWEIETELFTWYTNIVKK